MVRDLTGMDVATASLLDEATAAAEAMTLLHRVQGKRISTHGSNRFLVSDTCFPQTIDVLHARAEPLGIEVVVQPASAFTFADNVFGVLLQTPDERGVVH